jgi:hypothetical protein
MLKTAFAAFVLFFSALVCYVAVTDAATASPSVTGTGNVAVGTPFIIYVPCGNVMRVPACRKSARFQSICETQLLGTFSETDGTFLGRPTKNYLNCTFNYPPPGWFTFKTGKFDCTVNKLKKLKKFCAKIPRSTLTSTAIAGKPPAAAGCEYNCSWA